MAVGTIGVKGGNVLVPYTPYSQMPAGTVVSYAGSIAGFTSTAVADSSTLVSKDGWAVCNGASIPFATYSQLYARLSTTWNATTNPLTGSSQSAPADTGVNFRIPNLQGVFLRGVGDYAGSNEYSTDNDVALAIYKSDRFQGHWHQAAVDNSGVGAYAGFNKGAFDDNTTSNSTNQNIKDPIADGTNGTPRVGKETAPKEIGVYYLVKLYDNVAPIDVYIPFGQTGMPGETLTSVGSVSTVASAANPILFNISGAPTVTLTSGGKWLVEGSLLVVHNAGGYGAMSLSVSDGTNHYGASPGFIPSGTIVTIPFSTILSYSGASTKQIYFRLVDNNGNSQIAGWAGNAACGYMQAIRLTP